MSGHPYALVGINVPAHQVDFVARHLAAACTVMAAKMDCREDAAYLRAVAENLGGTGPETPATRRAEPLLAFVEWIIGMEGNESLRQTVALDDVIRRAKDAYAAEQLREDMRPQ